MVTIWRRPYFPFLSGSICHHLHCHKEYLIILAVVSGLILCTTLAVVVWLLAYKRSKKRRRSRKLSNPAASALVPPSWKVFAKEELKSITKNFSEGNRLVRNGRVTFSNNIIFSYNKQYIAIIRG